MLDTYICERFGISRETAQLAGSVERELAGVFSRIEQTENINQLRVLESFLDNNVSTAHLQYSNGYGYNDEGRDCLDRIYAQVFGKEDALVRHHFVSGTHAITTALFGVLRPGDCLCCITGQPYDTLKGTISGKNGSLEEFGIKTIVVPLINGQPDMAEIEKVMVQNKIRVVHMQRSCGYSWRPSLSTQKINQLSAMVKSLNPQVITFLDNCYGEFVEQSEPTVDLMAGSLIKNPGGTLAACGGYIAGSSELVAQCAGRMTTPGQGRECGASLGQLRQMYQGLLVAPNVVAAALKAAAFAAGLFERLGFETLPSCKSDRACIIQAVKLGSREKLIDFCGAIQSKSPVDSFLTPVPAPMAGYDSEVIMAAGAFVQGASIEQSADAPLRPPYIAYVQGGISYCCARISVMAAAQAVAHRRD